MKLRLLTLAACLALLAPSALAQRNIPGLEFFPQKPDGTRVQSRVYTSAALADAAGTRVAKVLTGTALLTNGRTIAALRLSGQGLTPGASYTLVLDGHVVGSATANAAGILKMKFASPTRGRVAQLPDTVLPLASIRTATLFDTASQAAVASGNFTTVR
jgi:hypothetical protein